MLAVPVFDMQGKRLGQMEIDPEALGGKVRPDLLKQVIVTFQDHRRQESARTKARADVEGSTRKLYRQKGTGNARAGTIRTPVRRGGGRTFGKRVPRSFKDIPKKMRRLARNNAVLAKIQADEVMIVDGLRCDAPKTKTIAAMFNALGIQGGCLLTTHEHDNNVYRSTRNIASAGVCALSELNAHDVLLRRNLIFTKAAFERFTQSTGPATTAS